MRLRRMNIIVLFLWICSGGKCDRYFFTNCNKYYSEILSYLVQTEGLQLTFCKANDSEGWMRGKDG